MLFRCDVAGALAGKTRLLVTNQLHFLPRCDYVYVLNGGSIVEQGTYDSLVQNGEGCRFLLVPTVLLLLSRC
jgi:ATP-binding cassette subfamily C (CFTR/MRP) protein 1